MTLGALVAAVSAAGSRLALTHANRVHSAPHVVATVAALAVMAVSVHGLLSLPDGVLGRRSRQVGAGLWYAVALLVAITLTTTAHVLAPWPAAFGWLVAIYSTLPTVHARYLDAPAVGRQRMQWIAVGAVLGSEVILIAVTLNLLVAWPAQIAVPAAAADRAGGIGPALRGEPTPGPPRRSPAREPAVDPRLHRRGGGHLPHRGPRPRQDTDGDDRPRGARPVDRRRRYRRHRVHPRSRPIRAHGDRLRLRSTRSPRRGGANVREPPRRGPYRWTSCSCSWPSHFARRSPFGLRRSTPAPEKSSSSPYRSPTSGQRSIVVSARERPVITHAGVSGNAWASVWMPALLNGRPAGPIRVAPICHAGELLGHDRGGARRRAQPPSSKRTTAFSTDLARQVGLAFHNAQLDTALQTSLDELRRQADELRGSRARIVASGDAERRRVERNLHDGAQQHLVALAVNLRLAKDVVLEDPEAAVEMLEELGTAVQDTIQELRELAHGIYPPLLVDSGLAGALRPVVNRSPLDIELSTEGIGRYAGDVEAALYFCCLEALQNAGKYAPDAHVTVRIWEESGDCCSRSPTTARASTCAWPSTGTGSQT